MKVATVLYVSELESIAKNIITFLEKNQQISCFEFNITADNALKWKNFNTALKVSDVALPILYEVQENSEPYKNIRHYYECTGRVEAQLNKPVLPIYTTPENGLQADTKKLIPKNFFTNVLSMNWNQDMQHADNIAILAKKLSMLDALQNTTNGDAAAGVHQINAIKRLVSADDFSGALKTAYNFIGQNNLKDTFEDDLVLLENKYHNITKQYNTRVISFADYLVVKNQLTEGMLNFLKMVKQQVQP